MDLFTGKGRWVSIVDYLCLPTLSHYLVKKRKKERSSHHGSVEINLTSIHEDQDWSLALLSGLGIRCFGELWYRLAAVAPIIPLAWETPYAMGAALKRQKRKKRKEKENSYNNNKTTSLSFSSLERNTEHGKEKKKKRGFRNITYELTLN